MSALGDQFRDAAKWLEKHRHSGCCIAIKNRNRLRAAHLFRHLFCPDHKGDFNFWWRWPPRDRLARLIALDLAALIADEEGA